MIKVKVETELFFKSEKEYQKYLDSPEMKYITGFKNEIETAFATGKPVEFKTPRTELGTVSRSHITCYEVFK